MKTKQSDFTPQQLDSFQTHILDEDITYLKRRYTSFLLWSLRATAETKGLLNFEEVDVMVIIWEFLDSLERAEEAAVQNHA